MSLQVVEDVDNKLLGRREVKCIFPKSAGSLTRSGAAKAVAEAVKVPPENVVTVSVRGSAGTMKTVGTFYVYPKPEATRKYLPPYIMARMLPKEERKKLQEAKKKETAKKPSGKK